MNSNVGGLDKLFRILLAMIVMGIGFYDPSKWWLFVIGIVPLLTGIFSFCPLYKIFGFSTCNKDNCDPQ